MPSQRSWQERTTRPISPSSPPTRRSSSSPSIVWRCITARSSSLSGPALLMIEFGTRTLPTSCSRAANSASRRSRADSPSRSTTRERQLHDVPAVHARVLVVGLDHVAEQEGGAAVGVAELELVVDPHAALAREDREQADQRQREQHAVRRRLGGEGHGEPDRSQARVDHVDRGHRPQVVLRRHAERRPLAGGGDGEVERELRGQRRQVERPAGRAKAVLRRRARARAPGRSRTRRSAGAARVARGAAPRAGTRSSSPSSTPAATANGTQPVGSTKSIGTRISSVGTAVPLPISNSSLNAAAYAPTSTSTAPRPGARSDGRYSTSAVAAATKALVKRASDHSSRLARRWSRRTRASSITRCSSGSRTPARGFAETAVDIRRGIVRRPRERSSLVRGIGASVKHPFG